MGTLRLSRTTITHFYENLALIRNNLDISSFCNTLAEQAPPIRLPKPTINLGPIFHQIQKWFRNLSPTFLTCNANWPFYSPPPASCIPRIWHELRSCPSV
ncbi:unnamed protein product [Rhizopus stolonifer]